MNPFYNKKGEPIGYFAHDDSSIFSLEGLPLGYLEEESIYSFNGDHLGWFIDGWITDHKGQAVFFTKDAPGGPFKPSVKILPNLCNQRALPNKNIKKIPPSVRPTLSRKWTPDDSSFFADLPVETFIKENFLK